MATAQPASQRLLDAASDLFYEHGIASTGVDLIAARSGVAKTTMYAHYGNKDGLVAAYLEARGRAWREHLASEVSTGASTPRDQLLRVFDVLGEWMSGPDFCGCPFIKAASEIDDPDHPAWRATEMHRTWLRGYLTGLTQRLRVDDPAALATSLLMLYDAAMVHSAIDSSGDAPARDARRTAEVLIDAART